MYPVFENEAFGFLYMCLTGFLSGISYHFIKAAFLPYFKHRILKIISDIFTLSAIAFIISFSLIYYNFAEFRYYIPLGLILGLILYLFLFARIIFPVFKVLWQIFFKICMFISKILLTPIKFFYKIIVISCKAIGKVIKAVKTRLLVCIGRIVNEQRDKTRLRIRKRKEKAGRKVYKKHRRNRRSMYDSGSCVCNSGHR